MTPDGRADLHTHSNVSDGTEPPEVVVAEAARAGLAAVALTDHDTVAGWAAATVAAEENGITLVRGMEMSCRAGHVTIHLLSYLHAAVSTGVIVVDYSDEATAAMTTRGNSGRITSATLRPRVTVADPAMVDAARAAHALAHQWCFIANSVAFEVHLEPETLVARPTL